MVLWYTTHYSTEQLSIYDSLYSSQVFTIHELSVKLGTLFLQHLTRKFNLKEPSTIIYDIDICTFEHFHLKRIP